MQQLRTHVEDEEKFVAQVERGGARRRLQKVGARFWGAAFRRSPIYLTKRMIISSHHFSLELEMLRSAKRGRGAICTRSRCPAQTSSGRGKIIRALVVAVDRLDDLHQDVVEQRAGAEPEEIGREPVVAERFL